MITFVLSLGWCRVDCVSGPRRPVLAGTHQCATEYRVTLWQSANYVRAVGASAVVFSPLANVFVSLSSVMVFRIVKLVILQTIVTLVFCGILESLQKQ